MRGKLALRFVQSPSEPSGALSGVPQQQPHHRVMTASEVDAGDLQVAAINVALVQSDTAVDCHLLVRATAHGVIGTFHHCVAFRVGEAHGAILRVVHGAPDTAFGLDERLISIGIELRDERSAPIYGNGGVLIERIGIVHGGLAILQREFTVPYVIIGVLVILAVDSCYHQFGAGIVREGVVHHHPLSRSIAGGRASEDIVCVLKLRYKGAATMVSHAGEQVTIRLVGLRKRHIIRLGELVQQIGTKGCVQRTMYKGQCTKDNVQRTMYLSSLQRPSCRVATL